MQVWYMLEVNTGSGGLSISANLFLGVLHISSLEAASLANTKRRLHALPLPALHLPVRLEGSEGDFDTKLAEVVAGVGFSAHEQLHPVALKYNRRKLKTLQDFNFRTGIVPPKC